MLFAIICLSGSTTRWAAIYALKESNKILKTDCQEGVTPPGECSAYCDIFINLLSHFETKLDVDLGLTKVLKQLAGEDG